MNYPPCDTLSHLPLIDNHFSFHLSIHLIILLIISLLASSMLYLITNVQHGGCQLINYSEEGKQHKEEESSRRFQRGLLIGLGAIGGGALLGIQVAYCKHLISAIEQIKCLKSRR